MVALKEKISPANGGDIRDSFYPWPLEEGMATHSSILAWRIPWTEEPGGLRSMGSPKSQTELKQLSTYACMHNHTYQVPGVTHWCLSQDIRGFKNRFLCGQHNEIPFPHHHLQKYTDCLNQRLIKKKQPMQEPNLAATGSCKCHFIGTKPHPFIYILSVAVFTF